MRSQSSRVFLVLLGLALGLGTWACEAEQQAATTPLTPTTAAEPHDPRLLLRHEYNGDFEDSSQKRNPGIPVGDVVLTEGCADGAAGFDGWSYVQVEYSRELQPREVSVEVFFKPSRDLGNGSTFVPLVVKLPPGRSFGSYVDGFDIAYQDPWGTGGRIGFGIGGESGRIRHHASRKMTLEAGRFHHVVGTYDGETIKLYVNGVLEATTHHTDPIEYLQGPIRIGGNIRHHLIVPSGEPQFFEGIIDEVAIYGRALTPDEIQEHAARCVGL